MTEIGRIYFIVDIIVRSYSIINYRVNFINIVITYVIGRR